MVRILWFKEASRWSRRGIPLRVVWVSPRQLGDLLLFCLFLFGFSLSVPLPTQTLKLVAVGSTLLAGAVVSFWRVKMQTPEQLIVARLRGLTTFPQLGEERACSLDKASSAVEKSEERAFEMVADSAESFTPLSISGRWRRTKLPRKVSLYVDGVPQARRSVPRHPGQRHGERLHDSLRSDRDRHRDARPRGEGRWGGQADLQSKGRREGERNPVPGDEEGILNAAYVYEVGPINYFNLSEPA